MTPRRKVNSSRTALAWMEGLAIVLRNECGPEDCRWKWKQRRFLSRSSRSEPLPVFAGHQERLDHFGGHVIPVELVQLRQPEVIAGVIRVLRIVGIAS